mgnify:FL=1
MTNTPTYFETEMRGIGTCYIKVVAGNSMLVVTKKTNQGSKTLNIAKMSGVISTRGTKPITKYEFDQNFNGVYFELALLKNTD